MFKKLLLLSGAICLAFVMSGCSKYSTNIEITDKDEVALTQSVLVSKDLYKLIDTNFNPDDPYKNWDKFFDKKTENYYRERDFRVRNLSDETYMGKEFTKKYKHIKFFFKEDLPEGYLMTSESSMPIEIIKKPFNPFVTYYHINLKFDPKKLQEKGSELYLRKRHLNNLDTPISYSVDDLAENSPLRQIALVQAQLRKQPVLDITIKIPKPAYEHNATNVDAKKLVYTWNLSEMDLVKDGKSMNIIIKYKKINYFSILILLLVLIGTGITVLKNKKFSEARSDETMDAF